MRDEPWTGAVTPDRQRKIARILSRVGGAVGALCVAVMTADYAAARLSVAAEAERLAHLQKQTETDASFAPQLSAEQDRITRVRRARKERGDVLSVLLIGAVSAFLAGSKWLIALEGPRPAVTLIPLASVKARPPAQSVVTANPPESAPPLPPGIDLSFVDRVVAEKGRSREAAIGILQAIQSHYRYLPDEALKRVCELTEITPAQIAGTSSFYAQFRRLPVGEHVIRVCHGTACHVAGARQISEELRRQLRIPSGADTDPERRFTLDEVACLGCCSLAPVLMVNERAAGRLTPATALTALDGLHQAQPA